MRSPSRAGSRSRRPKGGRALRRGGRRAVALRARGNGQRGRASARPRAIQQAEADRVKKEKAVPVVQANEKAAGKRSMTKGMVIGGSVGVFFCIVAVFAIVSWMNNTVSPTLTPNIPITTLEGTWIGKMDEIEGDDRIYDVRLSVNQSLTGEVVLDGPNHEVYSIVEGSWDGYNFWFKDDQELYWWGTYENGHLIGGWGPGLEYLYLYTFDLTR